MRNGGSVVGGMTEFSGVVRAPAADHAVGEQDAVVAVAGRERSHLLGEGHHPPWAGVWKGVAHLAQLAGVVGAPATHRSGAEQSAGCEARPGDGRGLLAEGHRGLDGSRIIGRVVTCRAQFAELISSPTADGAIAQQRTGMGRAGRDRDGLRPERHRWLREGSAHWFTVAHAASELTRVVGAPAAHGAVDQQRTSMATSR